jgi:cell fate regulator YaaT (PSP1 superfamily)
MEIGRVVYINKEISSENEEEIKDVVRVADEKDLARQQRMAEEGNTYFESFAAKSREMGLELKPVKAEFSFDGERIIFYFTAENRVDFRDYIKEMSRESRKQIIMRQIGSRDEAKMIGGYGICGQPVCCKRFLTKIESVTMDMARDQFENNINAGKVTGACGRLMCCLAYEIPVKKKKK